MEKRALGGAYLTQTIPVQAFCTAALQTGEAQVAKIEAAKTDFVRVRAQALAAVKDFARDYAPEPLGAAGIEVIRALGSFSGPARVEGRRPIDRMRSISSSPLAQRQRTPRGRGKN